MAGTTFTTSGSSSGGSILTVSDIEQTAVRIGEMWDQYNTERRASLNMGEEARRFVLGTDIDQTSAALLLHKNRTHQPKLTEISDTLQNRYFEASISTPNFYKYEGVDQVARSKARLVEAWVRNKLEQRKFRKTVGRELIADYVFYGNCFAEADYTIEKDSLGMDVFRGFTIRRISPIDFVFNNRAKTFRNAAKIEKQLMHIAKIKDLPSLFPQDSFNQSAIDNAIRTRDPSYVDDWVEVIKERGINMDGFGSWDEYFKQDMAELLVYRGDVFDPVTGETQTNRVVYVMDRTTVIRNAPSRSPVGFDGVHHAGWRIRPDNLWAQGPLDNLVGMQYRIDHLENLKADAFDLIVMPPLLIKGEGVQEPDEGFAPGSTYYAGVDEDVSFLTPDTGVLQADNEIGIYHSLMEQFAGAPPQTRGIRTPGEKTAFEVDKLENNANSLFMDKTRNLELMFEGLLKEGYDLMLKNFDKNDYISIFDDIEEAEVLQEVSQSDVTALGDFLAVGSQHWQRRQRQLQEMQNFQLGPMQDPKIRQHADGLKLAKFYEQELNIEDQEIIQPFVGVKEDVQAQAIAQAEQQKLQQENEQAGQPTDSPQPIQPEQGGPQSAPGPAPGLPGTS